MFRCTGTILYIEYIETFHETRFIKTFIHFLFGFKINPKMNFSVLSHGSSKQMYEKIDRRTVYPTTPSSNITLNIIEIT